MWSHREQDIDRPAQPAADLAACPFQLAVLRSTMQLPVDSVQSRPIASGPCTLGAWHLSVLCSWPWLGSMSCDSSGRRAQGECTCPAQVRRWSLQASHGAACSLLDHLMHSERTLQLSYSNRPCEGCCRAPCGSPLGWQAPGSTGMAAMFLLSWGQACTATTPPLRSLTWTRACTAPASPQPRNSMR